MQDQVQSNTVDQIVFLKLILTIYKQTKQKVGRNFLKFCTSIFFTSSLAVGAETIMCRAVGLMKPSSTALSINDNNEL